MSLFLLFPFQVAPEAFSAFEAISRDRPARLLQVTSPDLLYQGWHKSGPASHIAQLLGDCGRDAKLVCVYDGHPAALAWLGSIHGHRVRSLGVTDFGQTGDLVDLYEHHGINTNAIVHAAEE